MLPVLRRINIEPIRRPWDWNSLNRFFEDNWLDDFQAPNNFGNLDMYEDQDKLYIEVELPGFERKDIKVTLEDGLLRIEAEHHNNKTDKDAKYFLQQRRHSRCSRSVQLPVAVADNEIAATLKNGIMQVTMKKPEEKKPHKIEVK